MAHKLDRRPEYRFSAKELGPLARIQLQLAEQSIRSRGDRLTNTIPVEIGGRRITLYNFGDLAIYLEFRVPRTATLYLVIDVKALPEWFTQPTGTWFEDLDLE